MVAKNYGKFVVDSIYYKTKYWRRKQKHCYLIEPWVYEGCGKPTCGSRGSSFSNRWLRFRRITASGPAQRDDDLKPVWWTDALPAEEQLQTWDELRTTMEYWAKRADVVRPKVGLPLRDLQPMALGGPDRDEDLKQLVGRADVRALHISGRLTDETLSVLKSLPSLKELRLSRTETSDEGFRNVSQVSGLTSLWAADLPITNRGFASIARLENLKRLSLAKLSIDDDATQWLARLTALTDLWLESTQIGDAGVARLMDLSRLKIFSCERMGVGDDSVRCFASCPALRALSLRGTNITDRGAMELAKLTSLEELSLKSTQITDKTLRALEGMEKLKTIWLRNTKVSRHGLSRLREAIPECQINV